MEDTLHITTINYDKDALPVRAVMTQPTYPYHICDIYLPQHNIGYVYILVSIKYLNLHILGKQC